MMGQVLVEWELCDDLDQLLSRVLVVVELRLEDTEQRYYFLLRAQTVATSAHRRVEEGGDDGGDDEKKDGKPQVCCLLRLVSVCSTSCPSAFMSFAPKPGCPLCGIVNTAFHSQINSPSFNPTRQPNKPDILWKDDNFTVYKETTNPVSSIAHVIIAFKSVLNRTQNILPPSQLILVCLLSQPPRSVHIPPGELHPHLPDRTTWLSACVWRNDKKSSTDLPLLLNIKELAVRYLNYFSAAAVPRIPSSQGQPFLSSNGPTSPITATSPTQPPTLSLPPIRIPSATRPTDKSKFRIGFITPPFRDTKIPVTDHLHAHAYVEPADLMGWWRSVAYSPVAWYAIDDLIAEIR